MLLARPNGTALFLCVAPSVVIYELTRPFLSRRMSQAHGMGNSYSLGTSNPRATWTSPRTQCYRPGPPDPKTLFRPRMRRATALRSIPVLTPRRRRTRLTFISRPQRTRLIISSPHSPPPRSRTQPPGPHARLHHHHGLPKAMVHPRSRKIHR